MPDVNIWALAATGLVAGLLGATLGVGGGIIIVPVLTLALGLPMQVAIGSSLISIVINACTATSVYIRKHMTNLKLGLLLSCGLVPGAIAGGMMSANVSSPILSVIFGIVLLYVAYTLMPGITRGKPRATQSAPPAEREHASHAWLDGCYYDPAADEDISYQAHHPTIGVASGFLGGLISSLLGVGGGIVNVPVMNMVMKVPLKATIATSSLLLAVTTMTGSLVYLHNGFIYPYVVAPLVISIYLGARLGATFGHRARSTVLVRIFTVFLTLTSLIMIGKSIYLMLGNS